MPVFIYILIFFIMSCGPKEEPPKSEEDKAKANRQEVSTTTQPAENTETPPANNVQPGENNPTPAETPPLPEENNGPNPLQETGSFSAQLFLNQSKGTYQFPLDVYQSWGSAVWTSFYDDVLVLLTLAPNPRPQTEQMLIEAISSQTPFGKFCVVQSNFNVITEPAGHIEALHSISNDGNIVDMNNVKNTIKINTNEPLSFTLEFYGTDGAEPVRLNTADASNDENITLDFDSLCRSCGFEIEQDGLCQRPQKSPEKAGYL